MDKPQNGIGPNRVARPVAVRDDKLPADTDAASPSKPLGLRGFFRSFLPRQKPAASGRPVQDTPSRNDARPLSRPMQAEALAGPSQLQRIPGYAFLGKLPHLGELPAVGLATRASPGAPPASYVTAIGATDIRGKGQAVVQAGGKTAPASQGRVGGFEAIVDLVPPQALPGDFT